MRLYTIILILALYQYSVGQQLDTISEGVKCVKDSKIQTVDASYPGGAIALYDFLSMNLHYPDSAFVNGIVGTVYVRILIGKTGKIEEVKLMRNEDPSLDKEAIRLFKLMPNWNPGVKNGEPVNTWMILPLKFKIQGL